MMFITTVQAENQLPVMQFRSGPFAITATEDKITGALADFHDFANGVFNLAVVQTQVFQPCCQVFAHFAYTSQC